MIKRLLRAFSRTPEPFEWPPHLRKYTSVGPHLAVALRTLRRISFKAHERPTIHMNGAAWDALMCELPPEERYTSQRLVDAGANNFLLWGIPVIRRPWGPPFEMVTEEKPDV